MKLTCCVVEDEPLARGLLEAYIAKVPHLQLAGSFGNPMQALDFLRQHPVDVLFSDIQMPEITGLTLLRLLPGKPLVVLTTAYQEYALEGYELEVADYLLKPVSLERFLRAVEKVTARLTPARQLPPPPEALPEAPPAEVQTAPPFIFVKDGTRLVKVRLSDILYIEGLKDYVSIYTPERRIVALQTMKSLEQLLPPDRFMRVHHSYIIHLEAIEAVERDKIQIGKTFIPISDSYRRAFRAFLDRL